MAKAETNGGSEAALVKSWADAQGRVEKARDALQAAQKEVAGYARKMYEAFGTSPITVRSLGGRKYRALYKPAREANPEKGRAAVAESWAVIPVPENEAKHAY